MFQLRHVQRDLNFSSYLLELYASVGLGKVTIILAPGLHIQETGVAQCTANVLDPTQYVSFSLDSASW
jgi:hypothetical protein